MKDHIIKQLFFDDNLLFCRDNLMRKGGKPQLVNTYHDGITSNDYHTGFVMRLDNGQYRMLYYGHSKSYEGKKLMSAISDDGINFLPEQLSNNYGSSRLCNEIMDIPQGFDIGWIFEDNNCNDDNERYKLVMAGSATDDPLSVEGLFFVSGNAIDWKEKKGNSWNNGAEPLVSVFYNKNKDVYTIVQRPFWGIRSVGYRETKDWENFTDFTYCLNVDSDDECLAETYGMHAFEYDGMYIGLIHMYRHLHSEMNAKYSNGVIDTQLAYSYDGRYWRRSLRKPFISGLKEENPEQINNYNLMWVCSMLKEDEDKIRFYASGSQLEHGPAFYNPGTGKMFIYEMRRDGFVSLATENPCESSRLATREKVWHGGELHINLICDKATVAVYVTDEDKMVSLNVLGSTRLLEGYGHDDCMPFSGDCIDWVPEFKSGKTIDELKGKTIVFEIKFDNGEIFSLSGNYTDVFNTHAARYRRDGELPKNKYMNS